MQLSHPLEHVRLSRWQADATLLLICLIWGWTFVVVKDAISICPVFSFLSIRFIFALLALLPLVWPKLHSLSWSQIRGGVLTGLFLLAGYSFQTIGLGQTTVAKSGFITGLYVVLVPILSTLILRRAPDRSAVVGLLLAAAGLARLSLGPDLSIGSGDLLTVLGAVGYAGHVLAVSKFGTEMEVLPYTALQIATVTVGCLVLSLVYDGHLVWGSLSPDLLRAAFLTGVLATALVLALQATAQRFTTPTQTAVVFTMEPVFAAMFGYLLTGDRLTASALLGGGLILAGMLMAEVGDSLFNRRGHVVGQD